MITPEAADSLFISDHSGHSRILNYLGITKEIIADSRDIKVTAVTQNRDQTIDNSVLV